MNIIRKIFSKSRSSEDGIFFNSLEKILGFAPLDIEKYRKAFTHRSS
ncbi:MAG: ribonuclease III, partial [Flavobacterium sp.]